MHLQHRLNQVHRNRRIVDKSRRRRRSRGCWTAMTRRPVRVFLYLVYRNLHGTSNEGALDDTGIPTAIPIHYIRLETQNLAYPAETTLGRRYPFSCIIVHPAPGRPYRFRPSRPAVPPFGAYETRTETTDETGP